MKTKNLFIIAALFIALFVGCAQQNTQNGTDTTNQTTTTTEPDAVTSASIVDNEAAFEKAIGSSGTWIICLTKDLSFNKDLVLEGEYKNGKKDDAGKDIIQRKVALYAQDKERNITARFKLTAPKFTITSPEASIQHGTFAGDLYVSVNNFKLVDTIVDGNVYFTTEEAQSTFSADEESKINGKQELVKQ